MASSLTYEAMLSEIVRQDAAKLDIVADTRRMSATVGPLGDGPNAVVLDIDRNDGLTSLALNAHANGQVSSHLGIPKAYFARMLDSAPGLLQTNINHWLASEPARRLVRGFKPANGGPGTGRAYLSDRFKRLDNIEVARKIFPIFEGIPGVTFHQAALTDERFYLRVVLPSIQAEVKVGDIIQAGLEIRNSEVGSGALAVSPFVYRLICLNGMTVMDAGVNRRHVGKRIEDETHFSDEAVEADDRAFWLALRDTVKSTLTEVRFNEIAARLREIATGDKINAPIAATEELQSRFSLTDEERERVLTNLVAGSDLSQWGALNAITAAAKTVESFDRQAEMEAMGWKVASLNSREWASIAVAA